MKEIFVIYCQTGCSCCSSENHYRGPYASKEDAERRVKFYRTSKGDGEFWPVASQYARRGRYSIFPMSVEELPDGRVILGGKKVAPALLMVHVNEDGSLNDKSDNQDSELSLSYLIG